MHRQQRAPDIPPVVRAEPQQLHIVPAAGTDAIADDAADTAGSAVLAAAAAAAVWGVGALARRWSNTARDTADAEIAADSAVLDERSIRAAMAKQRAHNKATDATIAELRAEVAALNRKLNACFVVIVLMIAVTVAAMTGRAQ